MDQLEVGTGQHPAREATADRAAENGHEPALAERRLAGVERDADLDREVAEVLERRRRLASRAVSATTLGT